jgi:hypothetical protein
MKAAAEPYPAFFDPQHPGFQKRRILQNLLLFLNRSQFWDIEAEVSGYVRPVPIDGWSPDAVAWKRHQFLFLVETALTLRDPASVQRWIHLEAWARRNGASVYLIVEKGFGAEARTVAFLKKIKLGVMEV